MNKWVDTGVGRRVFKIVSTSVSFPLFWIRIKVSHEKGNPSPQILEYSTPRPKFETQIWISNLVGAKFSHWHLRITSFWSQLVSSLVLEIPRYSSRGFLFDFPPLGFTMLLLSWGTTWMVKWLNGEMNISSLGFYYASLFLENYINHQKYNISYVTINPFADYVYIVELNTRVHVGWKTLPNLNFKLKFQN